MKGPSQLAIVPKFDLVRGVAVDYMHCVLLGATRLLLRLWFDSHHYHEPWYIGRRVMEIDDKLCAIRPPDEMPRTPRSIDRTVKYWKGMIAPKYIIIIVYINFLEHTLLQLMSWKHGFFIIALLSCIKFYPKITISITYFWWKVYICY